MPHDGCKMGATKDCREGAPGCNEAGRAPLFVEEGIGLMSSRVSEMRTHACTAAAVRPVRRCVALLAALVTVTTLGLSLWSGSASALILPVGSFTGPLNESSDIEGIAVGSSTGDVYVYAAEQQAIFKFDAEGKPANFSATGTEEIAGVGPVSSFNEAELAVDNSSGPAKGDIYLARGGSSNVQIYNPAGALIGELSKEGQEVCGVAVDPSGAVYLGISSGRINKYVPTGSPVTNADFASAIVGAQSPCNLAADSAGNVFAITWPKGPITRYEASQFGSLSPQGATVDENGTQVAVDPANDDFYVDEKSLIARFGPHGEPFQQPFDVFAKNEIEASKGIAVSGFNGYIYVSKGATGAGIDIYANVVKPQATTASATHIGGTSATFNGTANPDGFAITSCSFEYGTTTAYGQSVPCVESVGAGTEAVAVHADVSGLAAGTTYHFRLIATNEKGTAEGADQSFRTQAPPEVSNTAVSHITATEASVSAEVNPQGLATSYSVEYGTSESYGQSSRVFQLPAQDSAAHRVTVELAGLAPATAYHARLVAVNALGTADGPDVAFTTRAQVTLSCPNEALRTGLSDRLPDCRAYEQVSPREKKGFGAGSLVVETANLLYSIEGGLLFRASSDGSSLFYFGTGAFGGSPTGGTPHYEADRSSSGWITSPLDPPNLLPKTPRSSIGPGLTADFRYISEDFSCKLVQTAEPLTPDTPAADIEGEVRNLYRRNADGSYTLISNQPATTHRNEETQEVAYTVLGATKDCKKIVFKSVYALLPEAPVYGAGIYEWDEGVLRPADLLPEGQRPFIGPDLWFGSASNRTDLNKVSEDGSRIFFEAYNDSFERKLYMREDNGTPAARTVEVDASKTSMPTNSGYFEGASKTGARTFFQAGPGLTPGSPHAGAHCDPIFGGGCDLYEYDVESEELKDLSLDTNPADGQGASMVGTIGISDDGSYVYFAAIGQLTPGSGAGENTEAQNESRSEANVYLAHAGTLSFVGRINDANSLSGSNQTSGNSSQNDLLKWPGSWAARVTPDGKTLLFVSLSKLTGYDNTDARLGTAVSEAYLYSADTGRTVCVSCNPSGQRPVYLSSQGQVIPTPIVPHRTAQNILDAPDDQPRALSDDGTRVFFESTDQLSPLVKGEEDNVYEWEQAGRGSCTSSSSAYSEASGGCVYLLDSGLPASSSTVPAGFVDATPSGNDVFIRSATKLLEGDEDNLTDIYDLHVGGGFAEGRGAPPCEGEACQGLAAGTPTFATPSTASFSGPGNQQAPAAATKPKSRLTRAQRLARALKACAKKKGKRRREACRRKARKRFGSHRARKSAVRTGGNK